MMAPHWGRAEFFKSSRSAGNGACVEVAFADAEVGVRDSKDPRGPVLEFPTAAWTAFLDEVRSGRLDY